MLRNSNVRARLACSLLMVVLAVSVGIGTTRLNGQAATATIQGTASDMSGAAVPGASIQAKNTGTGATQTVTSNAQGRFALPDLAVGSYEVQASRMGFSTVVRKGITLTVGAQAVVDFSLSVGQQQETVTVEGEATQVETASSSVGTVIGSQQMRELPLNGRNFEQLIQLTPGVITLQSNAFLSSGFQGRAPEYSIAGSRPEGQALLLDDESLQGYWNKGMGSVIGTSLGIEAIGEFQTLTNTYSAQFGGNGGVINAVSRSGTNGFHGSAYEFFRNSALDARQFVDPAKIPAYRQNQYGGSLGGPLKKDKMFFFVNYEGVQLAQGETHIALVPGCNLPAFAVSCSIPATTNPASVQAIQNTLRLWPNADRVVNGQPEAATSGTRVAGEDYLLGRWDYNISERDAFFARYISDKANYTEPFGGGSFLNSSQSPYWPEIDNSHTQFSTIEERHIFSPSLINVVHLSYSRPGTNQIGNTNYPSGLISGPDPLQFFPPSAGREDGIVNITGLSGVGGGFLLPVHLTQNRYTIGDDVSWTHGAHTVRVGASVSKLRSNTFRPGIYGGAWNFSNLPQFLSASPNVVLFVPQVQQFGSALVPSYSNRDFREFDFTPYIQEDWKVSRKLTLNLGLRWDYVGKITEAHDNLYWVLDIPTATSPYWTHIPAATASNPSLRNFDPRFGFAYDIFGNHKTSLRGGFGIFHQTITTPDLLGFWPAFPGGLGAVPGFFGVQFPFVPNNTAPLPTGQPGWDYYMTSTPYNMQYNLNIQHEIARDTILTVGYVGSRGLHLLTGHEKNSPLVCSFAQGPACANPSFSNGFAGGYFGYLCQGFGNPGPGCFRPGVVGSNSDVNPGLNTFPNLEPEAWSRYNSMLVSVNKRFSGNFQMTASYVWSRCLNNGEYLGSFGQGSTNFFTNPYNLNSDKAVCGYDQTHVFKVNGLYMLPFHGHRLLEGWQVSGIVTATSGLPFNIWDGYDQATGGSQVALTPRPNYVPGCQTQVGRQDLWFNPNCFTIETPGTLGNLGRNTGRGPNYVNTDFSVTKDTRIYENLRMQFRAEFFNIFNHTNLGLPVPAQIGAPLFTDAFGTRIPNAGQINSMNGTPRQIQLALKLIF